MVKVQSAVTERDLCRVPISCTKLMYVECERDCKDIPPEMTNEKGVIYEEQKPHGSIV